MQLLMTIPLRINTVSLGGKYTATITTVQVPAANALSTKSGEFILEGRAEIMR